MELNDIENIIDDLPFGIAVVSLSFSRVSPLIAGLQIGKLLGLPMPEDANGNLMLDAANVRFGKLLHWGGNLFKEHDFLEIMRRAASEEDMPALGKMLYDSFNEKSSCDFRVRSSDGEVRWLSAEGHVISKDSSVKTVLYSFSDITFLKKEQLSYQQELEYMEGTNIYNILSKERYNLSQNKLLSYHAEELISENTSGFKTYDEVKELHLKSVFSDNDRMKLQEILDREYLLRGFTEGKFHSEYEYRRKDIHHNPFWIKMTADLYHVPFSDEIECFICTYNNSENVVMKNIIAQMEIKKHAHFGIIDRESGEFVAFSQISSNSMGTRLQNNFDSEVERRATWLLPGHDGEKAENSIKLSKIIKELQSQEMYSQTVGYSDGRGEQHWMRLDSFYLNDSKDKIFFLENDITHQYLKEQGQIEDLKKAMEDRERAIEAKTSFFSSMSHDLRTPLNGIIGFTDIALKENDLAKEKEYLKRIKASGDLLMDLVNDTLDISRIENGKMELEPEEIEERYFMKNILDAVSPSAELKNVRLISNIEECSDKVICIDQLKTKKVLLNLLSNAIKFTPSGGTVSLRVEKLEPSSANGCTRRVTVEDTGIGMSSDFLKRLYEPFAQEKRPESKNLMGTGLGLTIVKRIIDLMNGTLKVESEVGKGTRFTIDVPVLFAASPEAKETADVCDIRFLKDKRALLCEDNIINQEVAVIHLKEAGMKTECADNGLQAVQLFEKSELFYYDIILMDIRMPVMDGYEAAASIRKSGRKDAAAIPILAMTADAFEEDIRRCRETGMNGHIAKPVDPEKMLQSICRTISQSGQILK